jgi:hypothetical protein
VARVGGSHAAAPGPLEPASIIAVAALVTNTAFENEGLRALNATLDMKLFQHTPKYNGVLLDRNLNS